MVSMSKLDDELKRSYWKKLGGKGCGGKGAHTVRVCKRID